MNKNRLFLATALALSLSWAGCGKSDPSTTPSTGSSAAAAPSGPILLKLKWTDGEHIVQSMTMKQHSEIGVPSQPEPMKQEMTMGQDYGLTVVKSTPDGGHEIELEFLATRMSMSMGGKTMMEYDSAKPQSAGQSNPTADIFAKLVGAKISYVLDATNGVVRLDGMSELLDRLSSAGGAAESAALKSTFNDAFFKQMMSQSRYLPAKPVQPGDTWPVKLEMPMGPLGTLIMNNTFTFKGWETHANRQCTRLDFEGTMETSPSTKADAGPVSIVSLEGPTKGTLWFDPDLGMIVGNDMDQDMKMVMSMGSGQSMTNHMMQNISVQVVSVK